MGQPSLSAATSSSRGTQPAPSGRHQPSDVERERVAEAAIGRPRGAVDAAAVARARAVGGVGARALLEDWDGTLSAFVKVTPRDYRRALLERRAERETARMAAAE